MEIGIKKIVIVGSGNVATRLAIEFQKNGIEILQVFGRTEENTKKLAKKLKVPFSINPSKINKKADLYILAVSDDAIKILAENLNLEDSFVVHTSGTKPMNILSKFSKRGVLYPIQTFSSEKVVDFTNIPLCLEASSSGLLTALKKMSENISNDVRFINSEQRKILHIGAVFVNNFANYLYNVSEEILSEFDLPFEILKPLIKETVAKIEYQNSFDAQTGPAKRNDQKVIQDHLGFLKNYPDYEEVYKLLSSQIKRKHH